MKKGISVEHLFGHNDSFIGYKVKKRRGQLTINEIIDALRENGDWDPMAIIVNPGGEDDGAHSILDDAMDSGDEACCVFTAQIRDWEESQWG